MTDAARPTPVLEVGGTHVTAALVSRGDGERARVIERHRAHLDSAGDAASILAGIAAAGARLGVAGPVTWGVAIPGPFDYATGVGRFDGVAKFESLDGVDVGAALRADLVGVMSGVVFVNDATAFALGECAVGAGQGRRRVVGITIGTGIGSAFVADGIPVESGDFVPPRGWMHLVEYDGAPLEEVVSRRAMRAAYRRDSGELIDIHEIADRARAGDRGASEVFGRTMTVLGRALAPWIERFEAEAVVVGGSIAGSWDLIEGPLLGALTDPRVTVLRASLGEDASIIGTAASV
ncbi:ROK family protein [Leifsonia sp. McL0607]|uniref:ROK family protein n=1 Tax=Leifsonia sp. McL0607 TaxID=3415672 RepID=UPI003CF5D153